MKISGGKTTISGAVKLENTTNTGRLSSVVSSADCRSALEVSAQDTQNIGISANNEGAAGTSPQKSAGPQPPAWFSIYVHGGPEWRQPSAAGRPQDGEVALVLGWSEMVHRPECKTKGKIKKVVAPRLLESEIADFLRVRRFVACGSCLRDYYQETMR